MGETELLKAQRGELAAVEHRAAELERQRIGRDLHDSLGQTLTGLTFIASALAKRLADRSAEETGEARRVHALATQATRQARALARGLCPVDVCAHGLAQALEEFTDRASELFGIECRLVCQGPISMANDRAAQHVYQIVQEAVTNAVRHGRATEVDIDLRAAGRCVECAVRDNGRGFAEDAPLKGLGLRSMHYRAESIGAELCLRNHPDGGVIVTCCVPAGDE